MYLDPFTLHLHLPLTPDLCPLTFDLCPLLQNEIHGLIERYSVNESLVEEIEKLREENRRLRTNYWVRLLLLLLLVQMCLPLPTATSQRRVCRRRRKRFWVFVCNLIQSVWSCSSFSLFVWRRIKMLKLWLKKELPSHNIHSFNLMSFPVDSGRKSCFPLWNIRKHKLTR